MVTGQYDGRFRPDRVRDLYADLGAERKVFIDLACSSHNAMWEKNHLLLFGASVEWLTKGTVNGTAGRHAQAGVLIMRGPRFLTAPLCAILTVAPLMPADPPALAGFSADSARSERDTENQFRAIPDRTNLREYMQRLSARPHHVGSPYDKDNAEWMLAKFKEWGWDAKIENYEVLFPTPKERALELTAPSRFQAKLQEPPVAGDPTSSQQNEQLPSYNAYSIDGDVTAPLVYVNYGVAGRLPGTRAAGRFGEGRDRDRPLRRIPGAASSPSWPANMVRWAASFIPIRPTTAISKAKHIRLARFVRPMACSAAA